jgi:hypothetical protein
VFQKKTRTPCANLEALLATDSTALSRPIPWGIANCRAYAIEGVPEVRALDRGRLHRSFASAMQSLASEIIENCEQPGNLLSQISISEEGGKIGDGNLSSFGC